MAALPGSAAWNIATGEGQLFTALELEVQRGGGAYARTGAAHAELPHAAVPGAAARAADSEVLLASDFGYVTRSTDAGGTRVFVPTLEEGFACNRMLDLSPGGAGASTAWGELRLSSDDRRYDAGLLGRNADQRKVRVLIGRKSMESARGRWTDPPLAQLAELFVGLAQQWRADERALEIPVRDRGAWLERPYLEAAYGGAGGADGSADIAGRLKPRLRGGSAAFPVRNVSPVLIDPVANVWQLNDGATSITALYEDGAAVFGYAGNTTNLWSGTTPAGQYRTDSAKGLFQLGSPNAGQITCDAWASFPGGATPHGLAQRCALLMLQYDLALPADAVDASSFGTVDARDYEAGWYWDGSQQEDSATAVGRFLASINCRLATRRNGALACVPLRPAPGDAVPDGSYSEAHIVSIRSLALPSAVSPPAWRARWGYAHNHTVMQTGINPTVTDARRQFLRNADRFATWSDNEVLLRYRRPNDLQPVATALLQEGDALSAAQALLSLWGQERRLYSIELPVAYGLRHELGDVVGISYPLEDLDNGRLGRVVGEQLRMTDATCSLTVLV